MIMGQGKNPSFHAYLMAKHMINGGHKNIKMLSLSPNELSKQFTESQDFFENEFTLDTSEKWQNSE